MTNIVAVSADGKRHVFPEGTPRDVVDRVMKDYAGKRPFTGRAAGQPPEKNTDLPFGERYKQGITEMGLGTMQLGSRIAPPVTPPPPPGMTEFPADVDPSIPEGLEPGIDAVVAKNQSEYEQKRAAAGGAGLDMGRLLGNVTAIAPTALAAPEAAPGWLTALGLGVTGGAASSLMNPVADTSQGYGKEKLKQAIYGAAGGLVGGAAGKTVTAAIAPKVAPEVTALMGKGVTPTPGQILGPTAAKLEDRLTSVPVIGNAIAGAQKRALDQFNKAKFAEVLEPVGMKAPDKIGYDGADAVHTILSDEYKKVLPNLTYKVDDQFISDLDNLGSMASELAEPQRKRFTEIVENKLINRLSKTEMMDGETWKGVESELSRIATELRRDSSFDQRELGAAVGEVLTAFRANLERVNPMWAGKLSKLNNSYGRLTQLENATARLGTDDGVFTPSQLMASVRATDKSIRHSKFARGEAAGQELARQGKAVLGQKYPDSGTVGRSIPATALLAGAGWADLGTTLAGLTAASAPYTKPGQWLLSRLMTKRPNFSGPMADVLNRGLMSSGAAGAGLMQP